MIDYRKIEQRLSSIASYVLERPFHVRLIASSTPNIAWTEQGDTALINLKEVIVQIQGLKDELEKTVFVQGLAAHEILHQIYTPFEFYAQKIADSERMLLKDSLNIVEDAFVDNMASVALSDSLAKSVRVMNKVLGDTSYRGGPTFRTDMADAIIVYELSSCPPGSNLEMIPAEKKDFHRSAEIIDAARQEGNPEKRLNLAEQLADILIKYVPDGGYSVNNILNLRHVSIIDGSQGGSAEEIKAVPADQIPSPCVSTREEDREMIEGLKKETESAFSTAGTEKKDAMRDKSDIQRAFATCAQKYKKKGDSSEFFTEFSNFGTLESQVCYNTLSSDFQSRSAINRLYRELEMVFQRDKSGKRLKDSGRLSVRELTKGKLTSTIFEQHYDNGDDYDTAICILVDCSGSTRKGVLDVEKEVLTILGETLSRLKIPFCVIGFNVTLSDKIAHHVAVTWNLSQNAVARAGIINLSSSGCNADGKAIDFGRQMLLQRTEKNKLLLILSDGKPSFPDDETAINEAKASVREAMSDFPVGCLYINAGASDASYETEANAIREIYGRNYMEGKDAIEIANKLGLFVKNQIVNS